MSFRDKVRLGRSGLMVSRIGIGSSYGVSEKACLKAFDTGVNYFFWGSARTAPMGAAIRKLAGQHRDSMVVVLQCYARWPWMMARSVEQGLRSLGLDYADLLLLGWHDSVPAQRVLDMALRLREQGRFRALGISSHQRPLFRAFVQHGHYDAFHIRYNAAHRGAESDVFPHLPVENAPGVASFTNTRWGQLLEAKNMPAGAAPMSARDCYRFVLSNQHVQVALTGPKNEQEMDEALSVLDSAPMDEDELSNAHAIGDHVHGVRSIMAMFT